MAKQKAHQTRQKTKKKGLKITAEQQYKMQKAVDRNERIKQGYDPAFQGGGAHGGTVTEQNKRARKKSKRQTTQYRNQNTRNLED